MYDLAIIGAGPAGYNAAERASHKGLKVVIFDKRELGGVCLNEGCIPTKTLLYTAKIYEHAKFGAKYGIHAENVTFDFDAIMKRKDKVVKKLVGGVAAILKAGKVDVIKAEAKITGKNGNNIVVAADGKTFEAKNLLIATGSEAFVPPIPGLDTTKYMTNREILQITELPKSLNIIGGGVIGVEFAGFFASMGTKVTVFEMMDEILPGIDSEICVMLRKEMEEKGVVFNLKTKVVEVKGKEVIFEKDGAKGSIAADELLVCVGRKTNIQNIGIETIGVELIRNGIKVDNKLRTNIPNVYAAGDITGFSLLAHTAYREGEVVVNNLTGGNDVMRYDGVPGVIYTNPEVSGVGLTEDAAKAKGVKFKVAKLPMVYAGRFITENEGKFMGLCKIIYGEQYEEVLGVHMIGNPSSEMIYGACMAVEMQMRLQDIREVIFPHPTVSEIFKLTAFA